SPGHVHANEPGPSDHLLGDSADVPLVAHHVDNCPLLKLFCFVAHGFLSGNRKSNFQTPQSTRLTRAMATASGGEPPRLSPKHDARVACHPTDPGRTASTLARPCRRQPYRLAAPRSCPAGSR